MDDSVAHPIVYDYIFSNVIRMGGIREIGENILYN